MWSLNARWSGSTNILFEQDETLITLGVIDLSVYDTSIAGAPEPFVSFTAHRSFVRLLLLPIFEPILILKTLIIN
jgi:hypothetical protein